MRKICLLTGLALLIGLIIGPGQALARVHKLDRGITVTMPDNWQIQTFKDGEMVGESGMATLLMGRFVNPTEEIPVFGGSIGYSQPEQMPFTQNQLAIMDKEGIEKSSEVIKAGVENGFKQRNAQISNWQYGLMNISGLKAIYWNCDLSQEQGPSYLEMFYVPTDKYMLTLSFWSRGDMKTRVQPIITNIIKSLRVQP